MRHTTTGTIVLVAGLCLVLSACTGLAAGLYFTGDPAADASFTITADDDGSGSNYWQWVMTGGGSANPGRFREFYDFTGDDDSDSTFNLTHRYFNDPGMLLSLVMSTGFSPDTAILIMADPGQLQRE